MRRLLIIAPLLLLGACTDPVAARRALDSAGFTDIQIGGYAIQMCGRDDTYATRFTARNIHGKVVTGAVCSGWAKGATVRFN